MLYNFIDAISNNEVDLKCSNRPKKKKKKKTNKTNNNMSISLIVVIISVYMYFKTSHYILYIYKILFKKIISKRCTVFYTSEMRLLAYIHTYK